MFEKFRKAVWEFSVRYACPIWKAKGVIADWRRRMVGGDEGWEISRRNALEGYKLVLDTIRCLPPEKQARWDVREIRALTESLVADMENPYISRRGQHERARVITQKVDEWNERTDYGRRD